MATTLGRQTFAPTENPRTFSLLPLRKIILFLLAWICLANWAQAETTAPSPYFKIQNVVVPVQQSLQRNATNLGFARAGETFSTLDSKIGWVQIQFTSEEIGWVPESSGEYVTSSGIGPSPLPIFFGILTGLLMGGLLAMTVMKWVQNRRTRQELITMLETARSRRGKRILAILPSWPEVSQILDGDTRPMANLLREWGYTISHTTSTDDVLAKARKFHPNILLAYSKEAKTLETLLSEDATLVNTPVVYLGEKPPRLSEGNGVRLHWMLAGNDKALAETLTTALRRSPKNIRHGVRSEGIKGELDGGGLWEVLHFLAVLRKSGRLQIETANLSGEIRLLKGDILFARMGDLADAEAVAGFLNLDEGKFAFFESEGPMQGKGMSTEKILLDWAKQRDEIHDGTGS